MRSPLTQPLPLAGERSMSGMRRVSGYVGYVLKYFPRA
jgi:hypothetical protein